MKVIFSFHRWAGVLMLIGGCVELTVEPPTGFAGEGLPAEIEVCPGCSSEQVTSGEAILLVNAKLSGPRSNFTANFAIDGEGRYIGAGLYLYDPRRECEDGGSGCRLARVGHLWLDDSMGALSVGDGSLERFGVRDLAWHPQRGLWGLSYDALNDEWGLVSLTVPDWRRTDNHVAVERYTFMPGPVSDAATDACYWRQMLSGLGFVGDTLVVGSAGKAGNGFDARGGVFSIPSSFLEAPSHCVFPNDRTLDPKYYACAPLCAVEALFEDRVGVAGDLTEDPQGRLLAAVRAEDPAIMPVDRNSLFNIDMAAPGAAPAATGVVIDGLLAGRDIDGLARVDGVLYGIDPLGLVYRVIEPTPEQPDVWSVVVHDDLSPLFDDPIESLRLRGATRVVVEP
jgi:hypothetical protein